MIICEEELRFNDVCAYSWKNPSIWITANDYEDVTIEFPFNKNMPKGFDESFFYGKKIKVTVELIDEAEK